MPGVEITTAVRTGPRNPPGPSSARFFVAGITAEGPIGTPPPALTAINDYVALYGDRGNVGSLVFDSVQSFFAEGGSEAYVARATGPAATVATLTLVDRAAGTPANTLRVDASSPGSWGAGVSVQIVDGDVTGTVTLTVLRNGLVLERYSNLASPAAVAAATSSSALIRVTNLGAATPPGPTALPAVVGPVVLVGGNADTVSVTATTLVATLNAAFPRAMGPGAIAVPGYDLSQVGAGLIAHGKANNRIALLAAPVTADKTAVKALAASVLADGDYAGLFWPWLIAPEGSATKIIPPEGYVAGVRARAMAETGVWQAPPGVRASARFISGTYINGAPGAVDQTLNNELDAARVNGITTNGTQVRLFNWRSLSTNYDQFKLLDSRDFLNALSAIFENVLDDLLWATIDGYGTVEGLVEGAIKGVLQPIADAGGLYAKDATDVGNVGNTDATVDPNRSDPGYSVDVSTTLTDLGDNKLTVLVGVRKSPFAALIRVQITKSNLTAAV